MTEPLRLRGAQFVPGALPGLEAAAGASSAPSTPTPGPRVTAIDLRSIVVYQGQGNTKLAGRVDQKSSSVGLTIAKLSEGYWVLPAGYPDPASENELTWDASAEFDLSIPAGYHDLKLVAFDADGNTGTQFTQRFCVASRVPDGLNACDPSLTPPRAVISLSWDTNVDLDLEIITPKGRVVTPKAPSTLPPGPDGVIPPGAGVIDRDSNAGCSIDGIRYENLVFQTAKPSGRYGVYVDLFDSCQKPATRFVASVYVAKRQKDGTERLEKLDERSGILVASQASGGTGRGLFLFEVQF